MSSTRVLLYFGQRHLIWISEGKIWQAKNVAKNLNILASDPMVPENPSYFNKTLSQERQKIFSCVTLSFLFPFSAPLPSGEEEKARNSPSRPSPHINPPPPTHTHKLTLTCRGRSVRKASKKKADSAAASQECLRPRGVIERWRGQRRMKMRLPSFS